MDCNITCGLSSLYLTSSALGRTTGEIPAVTGVNLSIFQNLNSRGVLA
jgi:hypothetical protein